uniref:TLC domain containing 2 n=1 Tax=Coturnix japonica TaxID=93934 RepID=A0A8C2TJI8_COTJA
MLGPPAPLSTCISPSSLPNRDTVIPSNGARRCPGRRRYPGRGLRGEAEPSGSVFGAPHGRQRMPMAVGSDLLLVAGSFAAFRLLNHGVERLMPPPPSARRNRWKWRNIWTSLAHSVLSGGGAGIEMGTPSCPPHGLLIASLFPGYFLEDFMDMLCNQKLRQSWELLFHHSYVGFALVALLVEINSIFLHLRQILLMADLVRTTCYRLNSIINLGTYVVFRIATLAWMTRWLFLNRQQVPLATYTVGTVGMAIMTPMNIILFYRLLRSDFFKSSRDTRKEKEK